MTKPKNNPKDIRVAVSGRPIICSDYVTIIGTYSPNGKAKPGNKQVTKSSNGEITKKAAPGITMGLARTVHVPDVDAIAQLLRDIGDRTDLALILGIFPDTLPAEGEQWGEPFLVMSRKLLSKNTGIPYEDKEALNGWHQIDGQRVIGRFKDNMLLSSWFLLDRDFAPAMPEHLANFTYDEWIEALESVSPGLAEAGRVYLPSTSGRVLNDGKPLASGGSHTYIQAVDGFDLERFGNALLMHATLKGLGFQKPSFSTSEPSKVVSHRPWSIFDPSVFSPERLVYDGKPQVRGRGLKVGKVVLKIHQGGRLETRNLRPLDAVRTQEFEAKTGRKLSPKVTVKKRTVKQQNGENVEIETRVVSMTSTDFVTLKPTTEIQTQDEGIITLSEFWHSTHVKLRCQATFRDSSSWNGILGLHESGSPFLFDNGANVKYVVDPETEAAAFAEANIARLEHMDAEAVRGSWSDWLPGRPPGAQERVLKYVHKRLDIPIGDLRSELKDRESAWKVARNKAAFENASARCAEEGRLALLVGGEPVALLPQVKGVLLDLQSQHAPVLTFANRLVAVVRGQPTHVSQIVRANDIENPVPYPEMLMIKAFDKPMLIERLHKCVQFLRMTQRGLVSCEPPPTILGAGLSILPEDSPPLLRTVEHPIVMLNGEVRGGRGYDMGTGLFFAVPPELMPNLPDEITADDAADSLAWFRNVFHQEFPFVETLDGDAAIAALLTSKERALMSGAPGHLAVANLQSSGKTALAELRHAALFGRPAAAASFPRDETEMAKVIFAVLAEGHPEIIFDNLPENTPLTSGELSKAMTSGAYQGRWLGVSKTGTASTAVFWSFNGNRVPPTGDFATRLIVSNLDARMEHPQERKFSRPYLVDWAYDHRRETFHHATTIVAGYRRSGESVKCAPSRYPDWDELVRKPLIWAGAEDVAECFRLNMATDPKRAGQYAFLEAMYDVFEDKPVTAAEIIDAADLLHVRNWNEVNRSRNLEGLQTDSFGAKKMDSLNSPRLSEAIEGVFEKSPPSSVSLGKWFSGTLSGILVGEYCLQPINPPSSKHAKQWSVVRRKLP